MSKKIPVAFFAYNRPEHTRRALNALSKCRNIEDCDFYLFSDGQRTEADFEAVVETRRVLHDWSRVFNAQVTEQTSNLGLAKSIVSGVTDLCSKYGRVVVVEDDLIVGPDFLNFMIQSLDHYENEGQVMQVGGFTLSPPLDNIPDAFLLPVTTTWGWATWQRAWKHFSWDPINLDVAKADEDWRRLFNLNGACAFSPMLEDRLAGRNDSWGILWWYAVSRQKGLVVYPVNSLVWNGGFDGSGIHCGSGDFLQQGDVSNHFRSSYPYTLRFPSSVQFDPAHLYQLEDYFRTRLASAQTPKNGMSTGSRLRLMARKLTQKLRNAISL